MPWSRQLSYRKNAVPFFTWVLKNFSVFNGPLISLTLFGAPGVYADSSHIISRVHFLGYIFYRICYVYIFELKRLYSNICIYSSFWFIRYSNPELVLILKGNRIFSSFILSAIYNGESDGNELVNQLSRTF